VKADLDGEDSRWLIVEDGFTAALANTYETLFTTGNGYVGTRGSLEEGHEGALPGTFLRGVFDHHDSAVRARITPENHTAPVFVRSGIDGTGYNLDRRPIYAEPPPDDPQMKWHKWARSRHLDEVARRAWTSSAATRDRI
jgi:Glycosyl hydrolase family 65, N-terminal domain